MPEPKHGDVTEPTDEALAQRTDEGPAEPIDEDAAEIGRHRSSDELPAGGLSRWIAAAALLIALVALAGAYWALWRPSWLPSPPRTNQPVADSNTSGRFTDQQVADAKGRACEAFNTASRALGVQTTAEVGKDPVAMLALAANARLAMIGGGQYMLERLDPATPASLAAAIRGYGGQLQDIGVYAMAGSPNDDPAQVTRQHDIEAANAQIVDMCK